MGDETEYINLKVVSQVSNEIHFRVRQTTQLGNLKKTYSERVGIPVTSLKFLFDGRRINDNETPRALEMEQNDVIEVLEDFQRMTLTQIAQSIEKIIADEPIIEAANNKMKEEQQKRTSRCQCRAQNFT